MGEVSTIGLDIAKSVFQIHGVDVDGAVVMRKRITRIEARPAQSIDRAVAANQSSRLAVAYQCIVFDSKRHCFSLA